MEGAYPAAVLISADDLAAIEETLEIVGTSGAAEAIREGWGAGISLLSSGLASVLGALIAIWAADLAVVWAGFLTMPRADVGWDPSRVAVLAFLASALLVAKLHELGEREEHTDRLVDKDAHDVYRLLALLPSERFVAPLALLSRDPLAGEATQRGLEYLERLFAAGPDALGSLMAGRAEEGVGDPEVVSASVAALAQDLLAAAYSWA